MKDFEYYKIYHKSNNIKSSNSKCRSQFSFNLDSRMKDSKIIRYIIMFKYLEIQWDRAIIQIIEISSLKNKLVEN